jgi:hypothetical protein
MHFRKETVNVHQKDVHERSKEHYVRMDADVLKTKLFALFREAEYFSLDDIQRRTEQPAVNDEFGPNW